MGVGGDQRHDPAALLPGKRPGTQYIGGWVSPRAGLDGCGKPRLTGIRYPDGPDRGQSLYRLRYPSPSILMHTVEMRQGKTTEKFKLRSYLKYAM
jgi:hypothetical protein